MPSATADLNCQAVAAAAASPSTSVRRRPSAVPTGGPDRLAGDEQARADQIALLDGGLDAPVAAARVAHRGEAAVEHGAQP